MSSLNSKKLFLILWKPCELQTADSGEMFSLWRGVSQPRTWCVLFDREGGCPGAVVPDLEHLPESPTGPKPRWLGQSRVPDAAGLRWGLRTRVSHKFPGEALCPGTTLSRATGLTQWSSRRRLVGDWSVVASVKKKRSKKKDCPRILRGGRRTACMRSKMSSSRWRSLSTCAQLGSRSPRETPGARPIPTLKGGSAGTNAAQTRSGFPGRDKFSSRSRTTSKPVGAALQHPPPPRLLSAAAGAPRLRARACAPPRPRLSSSPLRLSPSPPQTLLQGTLLFPRFGVLVNELYFTALCGWWTLQTWKAKTFSLAPKGEHFN